MFEFGSKRSTVLGIHFATVVLTLELLNPLNLERASAPDALLSRQNHHPGRHFHHRRRLRSLGAADGAPYRQIYSRQSVDRRAKHAGRRQHHRRQLRLRRRQTRRLDARRGQSGAIFRSTGRALGSKIRLGEVQLDRLAGKKRHRLLHARRHSRSKPSKICATPRSRPNAAAPAPAAPATTFPACSKKPSASRPRSSAAIPARRTSSWPSSAAKCFAGRRCSPPTSAASPIGAGINPVTCAS